MKDPFVEMYEILGSLKAHTLGPAIEWARARRDALSSIGSSLEFALHRVAFITLLAEEAELTESGQKEEGKGKGSEVGSSLEYARLHFPSFSTTHMTDIQHLMGCFVYAKR